MQWNDGNTLTFSRWGGVSADYRANVLKGEKTKQKHYYSELYSNTTKPQPEKQPGNNCTMAIWGPTNCSEVGAFLWVLIQTQIPIFYSANLGKL